MHVTKTISIRNNDARELSLAFQKIEVFAAYLLYLLWNAAFYASIMEGPTAVPIYKKCYLKHVDSQKYKNLYIRITVSII